MDTGNTIINITNDKESGYEYFNGFGGFVEGGREYEILLDGENRPPAPWINVIANEQFGFHVSETGEIGRAHV